MEYLSIKNWEKYQAHRTRHSEYIRSYVHKESDKDFQKLTMFQRGLLDGIQRMRGELGCNIENDATYIARRLNVLGTERARVGNAIATLIERGFLVVTNQQHDSLEKIREEEKKQDTAVVLNLKLPPPPETDGEAEFRKLLAVYPKPEDDHAAMVAFHERVLKNSLVDRVPEAETLAKIHEAAGLYRRLSDEGLIEFVYPMGAWLRKGICNHDPELWKGKNRAKRSQLDYDELPEFQKPV